MTGVLRVAVVAVVMSSCAEPPCFTCDDAGVSGLEPKAMDASVVDASVPDASVTLPTSSLLACTIAKQNCNVGEACAAKDLSLAGACFAGFCDVVRQECPADQRCTHVRVGRIGVRQCVPSGTVNETGACANDSVCARGLRCVDGTCRRYCHETSHCGRSQVCSSFAVVAPEGEIALTCRTFPACDPFGPACLVGQNCTLLSNGPICLSAGTVAIGQPCSVPNAACAAGLQCLVTNGQSRCEPLCNLDGGTPQCAVGACQPIGTTGFGSCR